MICAWRAESPASCCAVIHALLLFTRHVWGSVPFLTPTGSVIYARGRRRTTIIENGDSPFAYRNEKSCSPRIARETLLGTANPAKTLTGHRNVLSAERFACILMSQGPPMNAPSLGKTPREGW
jgi:hypothetical protein